MPQTRFKVYNASAGAGKTYSLVRRYLRICLASTSPHIFKSILAITFTNKAAQEMKERIVRTLTSFGSFPNSGSDLPMFEDLRDDLQISNIELKRRSHETLRLILHQYSAFSVSTIDKFTNRLIRTFAQDLKLSSNYEVELDNMQIAREAIDRMLFDLEENSALSKILIQFLNTQLEEGKSPRAERPLVQMAKSLFNEDSIEPINQLKNIDSKEFINIQSKLHKRNRALEKEISVAAMDALKLIDDAMIPHDLFSRGTLPKYIVNCTNGVFVFPNATCLKQIAGESGLYAKGKSAEGEALIDPIAADLLAYCNTLVEIVQSNYTIYEVSKMVLSNIMGLAVLTNLEKNLEEVKSESNRLPIGEFNKIVSKQLKEQPAAFLYERLGDRYFHYFIDEFQDTSLLQWDNLQPLVNNAMSQGGTAMLVGDGKQSIYRFRGGKVEQFLGLSEGTDKGNKVLVNSKEIELYPRETVDLPFNWRSREAIVEFNNQFFSTIVNLKDKKGIPRITNPSHLDLFAKGGQKVKGNKGGYVEISRIEYNQDDIETYYAQQGAKCLSIVNSALERGYQLKDIAVLNRRKKDSKEISKYLLSNDIKVVSPDSLTLEQSEEVAAIVSFLQLYLYPEDKEKRLTFIHWLYKAQNHSKEISLHAFLAIWTTMSIEEVLEKLEKDCTDFSAQLWATFSLTEKVYEFSRIFEMNLHGDPYLQAFMDTVLKYSVNNTEGDAGYLRWWDENAESLVVDLPDELDAVRMMTIHKSKGLEFPIVIVTFADWQGFSEMESDTWLQLPADQYFGLPVAKVGFKKREVPLSGMEDYEYLYSKNQEDIILDNLNQLYVALTRPEDELYIVGSKNRRDAQRVTAYFEHFLEEVLEESADFWSAGELTQSSKKQQNKEEKPIEYDRVSRKSKLAVTIESPKDWQAGESSATAWGKKVHTVLSKLDKTYDLEQVLQQMKEQGSLAAEQIKTLETMLHRVLKHPELEEFYEGEIDVLNENEILLPKGSYLRPDRLVIKDNKTYIIDYKTGKPYAHHMDQLSSYERVLEAMGHIIGGKLLVYLNDEIKVVKG